MKIPTPLRAAGAAFALCVTATQLPAQEYPLLSPTQTRLITQEVSGDAAYEHIRYMTQFHRPGGGNDNLWTVAEYFEAKARDVGLDDVSLIKQAATSVPWQGRFADLWIVGERPRRIASTLQSVLHLADYSRPTDVTAELVHVGGGSAAELDAASVRGKIVLTHGSISTLMRSAVRDRGALGIVWYPDPYTGPAGTSGAGVSMPDQLRWNRVPSQGSAGFEPTFAFGLSLRQGVDLRNMLQSAQEPVMVRAVVESTFGSAQGDEPWQVMVEGFIRGREPDLGQDIVLTGHLQEEGTSANDDASGSASVLEIARALNRLIDSGAIERPRRNIRFWWVTEIGSQRQYFADHPEAHDAMWVNVNQDMVGANQAQDVMRKQNVTRLPATRFHFFNDVVESALEYMVRTNTFELAQAQAGISLYPEAHVAHLGSMHRFNAEMIWFHNNSDHMPFNEAPIGVPAVSFTNMPDRYIHSSDDDLWNIDPTQLGRNAATVALVAYTMAAADADDLPVLAAETAGRGAERFGLNLRLGMSWIAAEDDKAAAYRMAREQIDYATARERMAISSLSEIDAGRDAAALLARLDARRDQAMAELEGAYRAFTGSAPPTAMGEPSAAERELAGLTPELVAGPTEFLTARGRVAEVAGLHGLMAFEVVNAVDGTRTGLDIYRFVAAEAREGGSHYFGTVTPEAVLRRLRNAEAAGVVRMR